MTLRAVLLDLDGTLLDTRPVLEASARRGLEEFFRARGEVPALPSGEKVRSLAGASPEVYFAGILPPGQEALAPEVRPVVSRHELDLLRRGEARAFPGALETLDWLGERRLAVGIVTNCLREYCDAAVASLGLAGRVRAIVCASDRPGGDKGDLVALAVDELGGPAVMVGDRRSDIQAGHARGLLTVGCLWGYGGPEEVAGADRVARDFAHLRSLLEAELG